jgi:hypothetical protein
MAILDYENYDLLRGEIQRRSSVRGERIAALGAPTDDPVGGDGAAGWR